VKVGDLVRSIPACAGGTNSIGIVIEMIQKKVWRTSIQGKKVNWNEVDPEPHAVVLGWRRTWWVGETIRVQIMMGDELLFSIPIVELEVVHEGG